MISVADSNGTNHVSSATYNAPGSLINAVSAGSLTSNFRYNPRLQLCRITAWTSSGSVPGSCTDGAVHGDLVDRGYDFSFGSGHNGNVLGITNYRDTSRSQSLTYDALNRIVAGWTTASTGALSWGENYSIDAWGNLMISPMGGKAQGGSFQDAGDIDNHASGLGYDAAGNLTNYTAPGQYVYDPENRIQSTAGMTYTYDADGNRVEKSSGSTGTLYWYGTPGVVAESDLVGNIKSEYVFFNGKRTARIDLADNSVHYYLSDHLGSTSMVVSSAGIVEEESDYSPFGTEYVVTGSGANHYKFTGKERDTESGLDYFGARYDSSSTGRFMSPDPDQESGFLYPDDPQAWNGYSYTRNNPLTLTDPTGEAFQYCQTDKDGKPVNCSNVTDDQHNQDVKEGVNTFKNGQIYDGDKVIGTYKDLGPDLPGDSEVNRQAASMIVNTFDSTMKEFGKNAAYAATGTLALRGLGADLRLCKRREQRRHL